jgi:hypothetical protein
MTPCNIAIAFGFVNTILLCLTVALLICILGVSHAHR